MNTISRMCSQDLSAVAEWMLRVPLWQRYGLSIGSITAQFEKAIIQEDGLFVIKVEGQAVPCGFAWYLAKGAFGRSPYLKQIGIHPEFTSMGLGAQLLAYIENESSHFSDHLFLLVSDFNEAAQKFYKQHGYQHIGTIPAYVLPNVAELIYCKRLNP